MCIYAYIYRKHENPTVMAILLLWVSLQHKSSIHSGHKEYSFFSDSLLQVIFVVYNELHLYIATHFNTFVYTVSFATSKLL